ncbi:MULTISPECIES: hypothetical protein [Bacteria]
MPAVVPLADPCALCGGAEGERQDGWLSCALCSWRVGDVIDSDLERPRVEVVYYLRYADRIKIGTSTRPRQRLSRTRTPGGPTPAGWPKHSGESPELIVVVRRL